jgi:hypothetical protein
MGPRSTPFRSPLLAATILLGAAALITPGCGDGRPDIEGLCQKIEECIQQQGQSIDYYDTCVESFEVQLEQADDDDCKNDFGDMIDCLADELTCEDFGTSACQDELDAYQECAPAVPYDEAQG